MQTVDVAEPESADARTESDGPRGRRWRHPVGVAALTVAATLLYVVYLFLRDDGYNSALTDVGIFDQAISGWAHFSWPHSPVEGLRGVGDAGVLQLSDHFTPMLALLAPLYWIHDGPRTLYVAAAGLSALTIVPLWVFVRRLHGPTVAYLVAVLFAISWPVQAELHFLFHEVAFAMPITAWMLERAQAGRRGQAALVCLLLLLVKDDMGFVVAAFGLYLALPGMPVRTLIRPRALLGWFRAGHRPLFLGMVPLGLAMVEIATNVLLPLAGGKANRDFTYTYFGLTPGSALLSMADDPWRTLTYLTLPVKLHTLMWLGLPVCGLCLFSPIVLLALPLLLERFLSSDTGYWGLAGHYNAFIVVFVFCAAADGLRRLMSLWRPGYRARLRRAVPALWAAASLAVTGVSLPGFWFWVMTSPSSWNTGTPFTDAARGAEAAVPSGVLVAAQNQIGVKLLSRDKVYIWSYPGDRSTVIAPWVVATLDQPAWPFLTLADQRRDVAMLESFGYRVVYSEDGVLVLHRTAGPLTCAFPANVHQIPLPPGHTPVSDFLCRV